MKIGKKNIDGFDDIIMADVLPDGYTDITSIGNWIKYGDYLFKDYKFIRKRFQEADFATLTDTEKVIVCQYKGTTEENCKATLGETFEYWMTDFDLKSQACRAVRLSAAKTILIKNVSVTDRYNVLGFLNTTQLVDNYVKHGIEGTTEGDPIEGIFNFIEATAGGTYATTGIAALTLTMINGITKEQMVEKMMLCLRQGEY